MNFWRSCTRFLFQRVSKQAWTVIKYQLLMLLLISVVLKIGFQISQEWENMAEEERLLTQLLGWDRLAWLIWMGAAPLMLLLIRRYPLRDGGLNGKHLGMIACWSTVLLLAVANLRYFLHMLPNVWLPDERDLPFTLKNYVYATFKLWPLDFLTFGGLMALTYALDYLVKSIEHSDEAARQRVSAAELRERLTRVELAALRTQLHPHFLFNSFNALATLVRQQKNDTAVEIIAQLSALLRLAIDRTGLSEIPLPQELDFIERYLAIERLRFGDKLRVEMAVEPPALAALVPNIVLQPLVENAIKHGISRRISPGLVRVTARREGDRLRIEIADDGPDDVVAGTEHLGVARGGIGLANTRAQLNNYYGNDYRLDLLKQSSGGTVVCLDLPFRPVATPAKQ